MAELQVSQVWGNKAVTLQDGQWGYVTRPSGMSDKQWEGELQSIGATEYQTGLQWAYKNLLPHTPTEWAIFTASAGAPVGQILGKIAPKAAPTLTKLGAYAATRVGAQTAAGALGGGYEAIGEQGDMKAGLEKGALQGFLSGMTGVGAEKALNLASRMVMGRVIAGKDAKALSTFMQETLPELQAAGGKPADTFAALAAGDLKGIAGARLQTGLNEATRLAGNKMVVSKELGQFLEDFGSPKYARPANDLFTPEYAMDAFGLIGQQGWKQGAQKFSQSAMNAQHLRGLVQNQIQAQIGPDAAAAWQGGQGQYAMAMELYRFFKERPGDVFPKGPDGGINFQALQKKLTEKYAANPEAQKKLGGIYEDLMATVFRGGSRVYDAPGSGGAVGSAVAGAAIGGGAAYLGGRDPKDVAAAAALGAGAGAFGHGRLHPGGASMGVPRLPSYAGHPMTPGGALDPAFATLVNDLMRGGLLPSTR